VSGYLADHGLELVSAVASCSAAVVAVLVYRRQTSVDDQVGWRLERDPKDQITLVRTGGGTALEVHWRFDEGSMRTMFNPTGESAGPDQRLHLGQALPRSGLIATGRLAVSWKQKRLVRTTSHTWTSQLP
jgi:hypothetical protein